MSDMDLAQDERADFADFLCTLSPEDWERPSLCEGWRVRDVVAHVISYEGLSRGDLLRRFARGRVVRANEVGVADLAHLSPDELIGRYRRYPRPTGLTAGLGGRIGLVDGTIHHQDVRRALGRPREVPPERLLRVLSGTVNNPRLVPWRWTRGVRLVATDVDWSAGRGPEVTGPGEALVMVMAGRRGITPELSGEGQPVIAARVDG